MRPMIGVYFIALVLVVPGIGLSEERKLEQSAPTPVATPPPGDQDTWYELRAYDKCEKSEAGPASEIARIRSIFLQFQPQLKEVTEDGKIVEVHMTSTGPSMLGGTLTESVLDLYRGITRCENTLRARQEAKQRTDEQMQLQQKQDRYK